MVSDPMAQRVLQRMAADLDMLMGTNGALRHLPSRPVEGQIARFAADVAGADAGLYEYRSAAWNKL